VSTAAIIQSSYIPWKGYFDIIKMADHFILYDDVQYTRRDWRNRNKIKTSKGAAWLTIPVETRGNYKKRIDEIKVIDKKWAKRHWLIIARNYSKTKYFKDYKEIFSELYLGMDEEYLSRINYKFIKAVNLILGIDTAISWSSEYRISEREKTKRLISLCKAVKATEYISGPAAKDYIREYDFEREGIKVRWMDYSAYPEYFQLYPPFDHYVSIIDLIFNKGPDASKYMKSLKADK